MRTRRPELPCAAPGGVDHDRRANDAPGPNGLRRHLLPGRMRQTLGAEGELTWVPRTQGGSPPLLVATSSYSRVSTSVRSCEESARANWTDPLAVRWCSAACSS